MNTIDLANRLIANNKLCRKIKQQMIGEDMLKLHGFGPYEEGMPNEDEYFKCLDAYLKADDFIDRLVAKLKDHPEYNKQEQDELDTYRDEHSTYGCFMRQGCSCNEVFDLVKKAMKGDQ